MKNILLLLLFIYFLILTININSVPLFIGDERAYAESVTNIMSGSFDTMNHPILARTIWSFFIVIFSVITGTYLPLFWRFGTLICSIGIIIVFYKISNLFFSRRNSLIATILLAVDPMFYSMSRIMQIDIPALFFGITSLYFFLKYQKGEVSINLKKSAIYGGLSLATKMYALVPVLTLPLLLLITVKTSKIKTIKKLIVYYLLVIFGFCAGNILISFLPGHLNPIQYAIDIIKSQILVPFANEGYLTSPPISWFTIPQILTLYRVQFKPDIISEIVVFQNPLAFILSLVAICFSIFSIVKNKINRVLWISIIWTFIGIYLPWFFGLHMTYYYYTLPLIPLTVLFVMRFLEHFKINKLIYLYLLASIFIFVVYFPLLTGIKVNKNIDLMLFKYSIYNFPTQDRTFCQKCSPRE